MTARTTPQAPGTPTWLDLWCHDLDAARSFWREFRGYHVDQGSPEVMGYTTAQQDGIGVFGLGPGVPDSSGDLACTYLATDDVESCVARARDLGAEVVIEPMAVPGTGTFAVVRDPGGVTTGLWQAQGMIGYQRVDETGFTCWQDCISGDPQKSADFLSALFGYDIEPMGEVSPSFLSSEGASSTSPAVLARLGDDQHFTIGQCPEGTDPSWITYLLVDDVDVEAARAEQLGAQVTMPAQDLPFGRFTHLRTPGGAPFGLFSGSGDGSEESV